MRAIVNINEECGIGKDGGLLVNIPEDMKFFRKTTAGCIVIMGRKTLESFPGGRPLKGRVNLVISSDAGRISRDSIAAADTYLGELTEKTAQDFKKTAADVIARRQAPVSERPTVLAAVSSPEAAAEICAAFPEEAVYVIGGASIYARMLKYCSRCLVTVNSSIEKADSYFPDILHSADWKCVRRGETMKHEDISFHFDIYDRMAAKTSAADDNISADNGAASYSSADKTACESAGIMNAPASMDPAVSMNQAAESVRTENGNLSSREEDSAGMWNADNSIHFEEIDSTNSYARRLIEEKRNTGTARQLPDAYLISSELQTAGRGRQGRSFSSLKGNGIYMSIILRLNISPDAASLITPAAAVGVLEGLEECKSERLGIKWVNDLLLDDKKVCGILTEGVFAESAERLEYAIIGIGINIDADISQMPEELHDIAGSVRNLDRSRLEAAKCAAEHVVNDVRTVLRGDLKVMEIYRKRSVLLGQNIVWTDQTGKHSGVALDIAENGSLIAEENGHRITLMSGEVSVRTEKGTGSYRA